MRCGTEVNRISSLLSRWPLKIRIYRGRIFRRCYFLFRILCTIVVSLLIRASEEYTKEPCSNIPLSKELFEESFVDAFFVHSLYDSCLVLIPPATKRNIICLLPRSMLRQARLLISKSKKTDAVGCAIKPSALIFV